MKRRLVILLFPIFCSVFSAMLPSIIYHSAACVNIVEPTAVIYQKTISYTGEVQAASTREIYLETPIIPEEVLVEPGDRVQKGSLLATIDTQLTKSVLAQGITISSDVESSEKEKAIYEQYGKAYGLTQQEISQLLGSSSSVLSQQSGSSSFLPAQIVSPIDGVVTQVHLASGVLCSPNSAVAVISSIENCKVTIYVKQSDIDCIQEGTPAIIQGEGLGGRTYQAVVEKIFPAAQKEYNGLNSETVIQTELTVLNCDESLKSGYSVDVVLMPEEEKKYVTIPYEAVCQDEKNIEYVWVVQNGRAIRKDIVTGTELPDAVEVQSGISLSDRIILSPDDIRSNQLVSVQRRDSHV